MRSEMCSLHLTHPSAHTPGAVGSWLCSTRSWTSCRSRDSNPQPWVTSGFKSNALSIRPRLPVKFSVKFPQSVMVWGAMSSAGVGPLCFLKSKVNAAIYQEILEHFMLPAADQLYGDADFIFQQDLAPGICAHIYMFQLKDALQHFAPSANEQSKTH